MRREAQGKSSVPPLATSSTMLLPGKNECLGTHCSPLVKKEKKDSSCQDLLEFEVKEEGQHRVARMKRKKKDKWLTCWWCRNQWRACRMKQASAEKPEQTGPAKKERLALLPQNEQLARTPEPPLPKGKEQSIQIITLQHRWTDKHRTNKRGGIAVNESASQSVSLGSIPVKSYQRLWKQYLHRLCTTLRI